MTQFETAGLLFTVHPISSSTPSALQYVTVCNVPFRTPVFPWSGQSMSVRPPPTFPAHFPPTPGPAPSSGVTVQVWYCRLIVETVRQERCPLCNLFLSLLLLGRLWMMLSLQRNCWGYVKHPWGSWPRSSRSPFFFSVIYLFVSSYSFLRCAFCLKQLINTLGLLLLFFESLSLNRFSALLCHAVSCGHIWNI